MHVSFVRCLSKHPFPFPPGTNPTPYEIFHLPRGASQDQIKSRYYELAKLYHPDANHHNQDIPPAVRSARFRAITHAYGDLHGRHGPGRTGESHDDAIRAELRRRSRRSSRPPSASADVRHAQADDVHIRYSIIALLLAGMIAAMSSVSSHMDRVERHTQSAAANLAQARSEAQTYGMERRRKIREHVKAFHEARRNPDGTDPGMRLCHMSKLWLDELAHGQPGSRKVSDDKRA